MDEDDITSPTDLARKLMQILYRDLPRLRWIDHYIQGIHADPYIPDSAGPEYKMLVKRAVTNWMPLIIGSSVQSLYVDGVRPGRKDADTELSNLPEWEHWQNSGMDAKQLAIYRAACGYGHAFSLTETVGDEEITKGLSPLRTSAYFDDPANDIIPIGAFTIIKNPRGDQGGLARMWDETDEYEVQFNTLGDWDNITVIHVGPHGADECPVTRFAAYVDLEGRTCGVVEPLIPLQDRINQTVFDMLVIQTGGAFKVRTISGMAPPVKMQYEEVNGVMQLVPVLDDAGNPVMDQIQINAMKLLYSPSKDTKFGTLDETPLDGYLKAIEDAIRQFSALSQTPPHYLLGQIANLSADAIQAAETSLERKNTEFKATFGESWERVFRLFGQLTNDKALAKDYKIEVLWKDLDARAFNNIADGVIKLRQAGFPIKGLLDFLPLTQTQREDWEEAMDEESAQAKLAAAVQANAQARASVKTGGASQGSQGSPQSAQVTRDATAAAKTL